jgi:hypothetical protein
MAGAIVVASGRVLLALKKPEGRACASPSPHVLAAATAAGIDDPERCTDGRFGVDPGTKAEGKQLGRLRIAPESPSVRPGALRESSPELLLMHERGELAFLSEIHAAGVDLFIIAVTTNCYCVGR